MKIRREVTKLNILNKITSYDIFKKYVNNFDKVGILFRSELRVDNNPTCVIAKYGESLFYRDFAKAGTMDCFEYVKVKYNVNFQEALEMINLDFNLDLMPMIRVNYSPTPSVVHNIDQKSFTKAPSVIKVKVRKWDKRDRNYWRDKYEISSDNLNLFDVYPLEGFWINDMYFHCQQICYGYYFGKLSDGRDGWKIYQPYNSKFKWFTNVGSETFQGLDQLPLSGDKLIITKSYKDVIILHKIGYPAIAPQSEAAVIDKDFFRLLNKRFPNIKILFDNDFPGIEGAERLSLELGIPNFLMPEGTKDASDYVEKYSLVALKTYIDSKWITT